MSVGEKRERFQFVSLIQVECFVEPVKVRSRLLPGLEAIQR